MEAMIKLITQLFIFSTEGLTITDIENLQKELFSKFAINSTLYSHNNNKQQKSYYRLYIPRIDTIRLKLLVYPYLIDSMYYKIGL